MIYFVQPVDGGPIKIGYTADVPARIKQLESHYKVPLAILATIEGDEAYERSLHARFAHLRFGRTEQFQPDPELLAFIGKPLFASMTPVEEIEWHHPHSKPGRRDVTVKIERRVLMMAKAIASHQGICVAELMDELLTGPVGKAYAEMLKRG